MADSVYWSLAGRWIDQCHYLLQQKNERPSRGLAAVGVPGACSFCGGKFPTYVPVLLSNCSVRSSESPDDEFRWTAPVTGCFTMSSIAKPGRSGPTR